MKYFNSLGIAALILTLFSLSGCKGKQTEQVEAQPTEDSSKVAAVADTASSVSTPESSVFPIAYVNVDLLLLDYEFAKKMNESLLKRQERSRKELVKAQEKLQKDYADFQKKYQAGGFLTEATLKSAQEDLYKQDQDLQLLDKKLTQEYITEQQKMNTQLRDTVAAFFKVYNADKRYKLILSNADSDNVLYAEEGLDITKDVVEQLNIRYAAQQKK